MTLFTRGSSPALRCSRSTDPVHRLAFKQQGKARTPARVSMKPHVCKTWVYFGYVWRSVNIEAIARGDTSRIRIHNSAYCTLNFVRIHVPLHTSSNTDAVLKASGKLLAAISPVHGSTIVEKFCRHFARFRFHKAVSKYITLCIQLNYKACNCLIPWCWLAQ